MSPLPGKKFPRTSGSNWKPSRRLVLQRLAAHRTKLRNVHRRGNFSLPVLFDDNPVVKPHLLSACGVATTP